MKKKILLLCPAILIAGYAFAQTTPVHYNDTLREVVVSASRWEQEIKNVPSRVIGISSKSNEFTNPQTTADMLQNTGQIFVQKSQTGAGSPVLRGFETNRILLVIDGIRMNNAIYRGGHVQDVITLDNAILDKTEVLFGPSSTLYGSDALGGVIHFYTKNPKLNRKSGNAYVRYSSANSEKTGHFDYNLGFGKFASLTSVTYSDFGDQRIGKSGDFGTFGDFGKNLYNVTRVDNKDVVSTNPNPYIMAGNGYKQIDVLEKILYQQNEHVSHMLNLQYSNNIGNLPRYDRMLELSYDKTTKTMLPTYAEWNYGPQKRFLGAYTLDINKQNRWFDDAKFILSFQSLDQDRISRKLNKTNRKTQMEDVSVFSANFDLMKKISERTTLYYGLEETLNLVQSTVTNIDITTGANASPAATRYPDGGNSWNSAALYVQGNHELSDIFSLTGGLRLTSVYLKSEFKNDRSAGNAIFPFDKAEINEIAPCGNLSVVANLPSKTKISATISTGFRAPNIDDMVKFFDNTSSKTVVVPNTGLKPEYAYNAELNIVQRLGHTGKIEAGAYYTLLDNALTVQPTQFNGKDSVIVDGTTLKALSIQNSNSGRIYGYYAGTTINPVRNLSLNGSVTATYGKYTNEQKEVVPMDHIPPMYGKIGASYNFSKLKLEGFMRFSAAKKLADYSPSGEDNLSQTAVTAVNAKGEATAWAGTAAWYTLNFRAAYDVTKHINLNAGIENILDRHYRQFASGVSAPGRNIYGTLRVNF
ncbi:MAG: TonB-dependent receptor [Bacteroidia bacterium]|nr:TonB-dependent receptor [Bacteroidia bacterium]